jgi:hypothetical protein
MKKKLAKKADRLLAEYKTIKERQNLVLTGLGSPLDLSRSVAKLDRWMAKTSDLLNKISKK